jgi:hypothetical protein
MLRPILFSNIKTRRCAISKRTTVLTRKRCKSIEARSHSGKRIALEYAAKLNVPLLPRSGSKQIVIGTTKYLLPYAILPKYFKTFCVKPELWTLDNNLSLIECIAKRFIVSDIIRCVTTPKELVNETNQYRVTAEEICVFKKYKYHFYKYISNEYNNIYFFSKVPLNSCEVVNVEEGELKCRTEKLGKYLYF